MAKDTQAEFVTNTKESKYQLLGVTYNSNNLYVNSRLDNGFVGINIGDVTGSLLVIEPISQKFINSSMLKVLNTQFNYFKFPARTTVVQEDVVDLDLDLNLQILDTVFARYRPTEDQRIAASANYSGIEIGDVQDGVAQQSPNTYTVSKDLKNSGADLRFRIKLQHRYDAPSGYGTAFFSIIKSSEQGLNRQYRTFENTSNLHPTIPGSINQYEVQNLEIDIVIPNSEFEIGDRFSIGAKAGQNNNTQYHTINALQSYWVITDASKNVDLWNQEINVNPV
jgi:hypothetical protein